MIKQIVVFADRNEQHDVARINADLEKIVRTPLLKVEQMRASPDTAVVFFHPKTLSLDDLGLQSPWVISEVRSYKLS
jgi:hypothetical protein